MNNLRDITGLPEYDVQFWNTMRGFRGNEDVLSKGRIIATNSYALPVSAVDKISTALKKESVFRNLATTIKAYNTGYLIKTKDCTDIANFIPENNEIPVKDGMKEFNEKSIESYKLASFVKLDGAFVKDAAFSIENYLTERFAKNFGRAEDNAFINGTGNEEPTGILHETEGADVGVTTAAITYDDVIKLYFSVKNEYRKNAVWMMNDRTALALRTLKDANGNYIWNHSNDTILGKKVVISEFMPDAENGNKPIAFGDFSYYWIVDRKATSIHTLVELFAELGQIGYLAYKFLDAKLIRKEAIKVIQMGTTE